MKSIVDCPCGEQIVGKDEDELVGKTNAHLAGNHPGHEYTREQILMIAH